MPLSSNGLTIKRFREIISDAQARLDAGDSGIVITDEANKTANNIGNAFSLALSEVYELIEEVYNANDILSAQGVALDRLVIYKKITRRDATASEGLVELFAESALRILPNLSLSSIRGRTLCCAEDTSIGSSIFRTVNYTFNPSDLAVNGRSYFLYINGVDYSHTATSGQTLQDVANALRSSVDAVTGFSATSTSGNLFIQNEEVSNFNIAIEGSFVRGNYSTLVPFKAQETGEVQILANTVNTIVTPLSGLLSVNNPLDFDTGSEEESDEELRERFLTSTGAVGWATPDAVFKAVSEVEGVSSTNILNNPTNTTDSNGLPPHSFEVIVLGGEDNDIAESIISVAPLGIQSQGSTQVVVTDSTNNPQTIRFTRPTNQYLFIRVEYEKYEEFETFPVGGEDLIRQTLVNELKFLPNKDIIPSSFSAPLYKNIKGLGEVRISCGISPNEGDANPTGGTYTTDKITISARDLAILEDFRITVTETTLP